MRVEESIELGGRVLSIETGHMAKQADGSVVIRYGDAMVLTAACSSKSVKEGLDFLPLTVEYNEKTSAAGKIPGGYFKREGRPTEAEVLTCRLIDRPSRPLFPKTWRHDTQLISMVISYDKENPTDILAMNASSAATYISDIPWAGPFGAVRIGRINKEFVTNPTFAQRALSDLDLVVAATEDAILMVEGGAAHLSEEVMIDALLFAHDEAKKVVALIKKLGAQVGKPKRIAKVVEKDPAIVARVAELGTESIKAAGQILKKHERSDAVKAAEAAVMAILEGEFLDADGKPRKKEIGDALSALHKKIVRDLVLDTRKRIDGRATDQIRAIESLVGVLPRTHGSALFTRGETQALVTATLGTNQDVQRLDTLLGDIEKRFMLHYNFPPFSTGETKPIRSASRREIGHGYLAERSIARILPAFADFPYTVRIVSEILESNGSSSMASVCGASLALMDAGVPVTMPVAGIAMGLIKDGDRYAVLSDILGDEDHLGDMDFKVTGTKQGITALQMDMKVQGLSRDILMEAMQQAKAGRLHILGEMAKAMTEPREELSRHAPRITTIMVKPDRIRDIIGPGGKMIRAIIEQTGVAIDVADDGTVSIASPDDVSTKKALEIIRGLTAEPEIGQYYMGIVRRIVDFGAFVEILPGTDGLIHISELDQKRVAKVEDVVAEGDEILVKVIGIDRQGKIRLSRKEALGEKPEVIHNLRS